MKLTEAEHVADVPVLTSGERQCNVLGQSDALADSPRLHVTSRLPTIGRS